MSARITSVTGGSEPSPGLAACFPEMLALADELETAAGSLTRLAERATSTLGDVHLLESAAVSPPTFGHVETAIGRLAGATLTCAALWEGAGAGARATVDLLRTADEESASTMRALDAGLAAAVLSQPDALPVLLADPPLTEHVVDGLPFHAAAALLGGRGESGVWMVSGPRVCGRSPRGVADLMRNLEAVDEMPDGTIEVATQVRPDGTRTHVVYLPGTDSVAGLGGGSRLRDMKENGRLIDGEPTAYGAGITRALRAAGATPGEKVLLVGHSQGGMQAAQLLAEDEPDVTNVVTAGSPIAGAGRYPAGTHMLSLENRADYIPDLDGAPNPQTPEQVTVRFDDGPDSPLGSHGLDHYVDGAEAVDAAQDPTVRDSVDSLSPFFVDAQVTSRTFVLTRDVSGG